MLKTKVEVQQVLNYQIENSCDEKLLKLMANRVKSTTKSKDLELAADVVSQFVKPNGLNLDSSIEDPANSNRLIKVTPLPERQK